ncbi:MAG: glycosyltransferase family 2 protein [Ginsengibacter sp.]
MKISIITVTLNSEKYLSDCIQSVRSQKYKDIEHIIIDGKSTDGTLSIIEKNNDHIANWISETDRGMYEAINKGINLATGDVIGILNSDDMLASDDVIGKIAKRFENSDVDSLYGDLVFVNPDNVSVITRVWKGIPYDRTRFNYGWMPAHPTFYMRRSVTEKFGLYENHFHSAADYEFMARYLFKHRISSVYLPMMIVRMRTGGASNGNLKRRLRANRRDYLAMKKNNIPFPFIVSILKPISKLHQYKKVIRNRMTAKFPKNQKSSVTFIPVNERSYPVKEEVII